MVLLDKFTIVEIDGASVLYFQQGVVTIEISIRNPTLISGR